MPSLCLNLAPALILPPATCSISKLQLCLAQHTEPRLAVGKLGRAGRPWLPNSLSWRGQREAQRESGDGVTQGRRPRYLEAFRLYSMLGWASLFTTECPLGLSLPGLCSFLIVNNTLHFSILLFILCIFDIKCHIHLLTLNQGEFLFWLLYF